MTIQAGLVTKQKSERELLIEEANRRFFVEYKPPQPFSVPDLYHYTTAAGLKGILESRSIFGTHIRYLNDTSEVVHAYEVARQILDECNRATSPINDLPGERFYTYGHFFFSAEELLRNEDAYVTSFCEDDDLLSQWRGYAMGGFSVGFQSLVSPGRFAIGSSLWKTTIRKILYRYEEKKAELVRIISAAIRATDQVPDGPVDNALVNMITTVCAFELQAWAHSVKDQSFEAEKEWRLISFTAPYSETLTAQEHKFCVRLSGAQLVPTIRLTAGEESLLPVASITCGPNADKELTEKAVMLLKDSLGYASAVIKTSRIPFRAR